ncbi:MAG TPA: hypothetical protein DEB35_06785 [Desulfuromonas sp.]|nr:hypothetical protein [Desulfuromonas sp.]
MDRLTILALFLVGLFSTSAAAALPGTLAQDLKPLSGKVVLARGEEILVDAGATAGVAPLDLFVVYGPATELTDPTSGKVIASLPTVKGVLQATQVKEGYASARVLRTAAPVAAGDAVRRFADLSARLVACAPGGEALAAELRRALPELNWQSYKSLDSCNDVSAKTAGEVELVVLLTATTVEVRDGRFELLRSYAPPAPLASVPAVAPVIAATPVPGATKDKRWYAAERKGTPVGVQVADVDGDGTQEVALLSARQLELGRVVAGKFQPLGSWESGFDLKLVALDAADLDGDGRAELYVTAARGESLHSLVLIWSEHQLIVTQKGIPHYFRSVMSAPGKRQLLMQQMGGDGIDFVAPIRVARLDRGQVAPGEVWAVPSEAAIFGLARLGEGEGQVLVQLTALDRLRIIGATGEKLWEGNDDAGGNETYIERTDPRVDPRDHNSRNLYLQPRLLLLDDGALVVPTNEGSRAFRRQIEFKKSHLTAYRWDGQSLIQEWQTQPENGFLADFDHADIDNDGTVEYLQLVVYSHEGLMDKGRYALLVLEP